MKNATQMLACQETGTELVQLDEMMTKKSYLFRYETAEEEAKEEKEETETEIVMTTGMKQL